MSGNSTAGPNKMHLGNKGSPHSGTGPQTNAQTLRRVEAMLDAASAETLDVDALEALLDDLQERAPVIADFDAGSILPELERSHPALFEQEESQAAASTGSRKTGRTRRFFRLAEVAVMVAVLLAVSASAMGFAPLQRLMDWASEVLHINRNPSGIMELPEDSPAEYHSLEEAMLANGVEPVGCPTWVPSIYTLQEVQAWDFDGGIKFVATYYSERGDMFIRVTKYGDKTSSTFEKKDGGYTYFHDDIEFTIIENLKTSTVEWQIGEYAYSVAGPLETNEIIIMLDSI